jgi:hypothetical protein
VGIELKYEWDPLPGDEGTAMGVRLVPGAEGLDVGTVNEGVKGRDGMVYDPESVGNDGAAMLDTASLWFITWTS